MVLAVATGLMACTDASTEADAGTAAIEAGDDAPSDAAASPMPPPAPAARTDEAASASASGTAAARDETVGLSPSSGPLTAAPPTDPVDPDSTRYVAVSVGSDHRCALSAEGHIDCWGYRADRRLDAPEGTFTAISAGQRHSCALSTEGEIACWGSDDYGRLEAPAGTYTKIDVGRRHSCAVSTASEVVCWGGPEWIRDSHRPPGTYVDVAAGDDKTCAIPIDAETVCWSDWNSRDSDTRGVQPGVFTAIAGENKLWCGLSPAGRARCWSDSSIGFRSPPGKGYTDVAANWGQACTLAADGRATCWDSVGAPSETPAGAFAAVSTGCGVTVAGRLDCWGYHSEVAAPPPPVSFTALAAGDEHSCGLTEHGAMHCWGLDRYNRLDVPASGFTSISAAGFRTCGATRAGELACWGGESDGDPIAPQARYTAVVLGRFHSCAITAEAGLECWGRNDSGESEAPNGSFSAVAAGQWFSCAVTTSGRLTCWGDDGHGRIDPPPGTYTSVVAGAWHACALTTDGEVVCWGRNDYGQMDVPDGTYTHISTNVRHTCAISTDGDVRCWGYNDYGQLDVPAGTYTDVATGSNHTCALDEAGRAVCWGHGNRGAFGTGTGTDAPASATLGSEVASAATADPSDPHPEPPAARTADSEQSAEWAIDSGRSAQSATGLEELRPAYCRDADLPRSGFEAAVRDGIDPLDIPEHQRPAPVSDGRRTVAAEYVSQPGEQDVGLRVTITEGGTETVHVLQLGASTELPPSVLTWSRSRHIVLAPDRWLIPVTVTAALEDLYVLVRRHLALEARNSFIEHLDPWSRSPAGEGGVTVEGWTSLWPGGSQHFDCFITWEDLGITQQLFDDLGAGQFANKPRVGFEQLSGYIWTARWGEEPVRAELADNRGRCCSIDVLDTGFVAVSQTATTEYDTAASAPLVHYARDGILWQSVEVPTRVYHFYELFGPAEVPIWVCSAESTDTGVLIRQGIGYSSPQSWTPDCGEATYWSADEDLTNWRKVLAPPPGHG